MRARDVEEPASCARLNALDSEHNLLLRCRRRLQLRLAQLASEEAQLRAAVSTDAPTGNVVAGAMVLSHADATMQAQPFGAAWPAAPSSGLTWRRAGTAPIANSDSDDLSDLSDMSDIGEAGAGPSASGGGMLAERTSHPTGARTEPLLPTAPTAPEHEQRLREAQQRLLAQFSGSSPWVSEHTPPTWSADASQSWCTGYNILSSAQRR